ncbi:MAG: MATE family efflux transporter [bacterium]
MNDLSDRNDLTQGPLAQSLTRLAGPMFVSTTLQNAQSVIDLFWVGRLGSDAVAALAVSGTLLMLLFPVVMGLSTGTVAMVARCIGAGRGHEAAEVGGQSLVVALVFGLAAGVVGWFSAEWLCRLQGGSQEVVRLGTEYMGISFLGCFTVFLLFIGSSILQASGNTMVPMQAMLLSNVLNIGLAPVFIFGLLGVPRMGVRGAALATVLAQAVAAAVVLRVLISGSAGVRIQACHWWPRRDLVWRLVRIGVPSSGQMLSRSLMSVVLMRVVAGFGTAAVAAYGIGVRFHMIVLMPAFVLGNAAATMVGQNLGASRPDRAERVAWLATGMDVAIMLGSALILMVWAAPLVGLFDSAPGVVAMGTRYLRVVSLFYVPAAFSIVLGRALQGAGDTVAPMVTTIIGLWGLQVPLAFILPHFFTSATDGIWWSIAVALTANGLMVAAWFQRGKWKHRRV